MTTPQVLVSDAIGTLVELDEIAAQIISLGE